MSIVRVRSTQDSIIVAMHHGRHRRDASPVHDVFVARSFVPLKGFVTAPTDRQQHIEAEGDPGEVR